MSDMIYNFKLDSDNQKVVDLKQFNAASKSITMLEEEIAVTEQGEGYKNLLRSRVKECHDIINKIREKYKDN